MDNRTIRVLFHEDVLSSQDQASCIECDNHQECLLDSCNYDTHSSCFFFPYQSLFFFHFALKRRSQRMNNPQAWKKVIAFNPKMTGINQFQSSITKNARSAPMISIMTIAAINSTIAYKSFSMLVLHSESVECRVYCIFIRSNLAWA